MLVGGVTGHWGSGRVTSCSRASAQYVFCNKKLQVELHLTIHRMVSRMLQEIRGMNVNVTSQIMSTCMTNNPSSHFDKSNWEPIENMNTIEPPPEFDIIYFWMKATFTFDISSRVLSGRTILQISSGSSHHHVCHFRSLEFCTAKHPAPHHHKLV